MSFNLEIFSAQGETLGSTLPALAGEGRGGEAIGLGILSAHNKLLLKKKKKELIVPKFNPL